MIPRFRPARDLMCVGIVAVGCIVNAGCNRSSPTSPLLAFMPGPAPTVYAGTTVDSTKGGGTVTVSLSTAEGFTGGIWAMSFAGKAETQRTISGTASGGLYSATFLDCPDTVSSTCVPNCHFSFTGSLTATSLNGTYVAIPSPFCPDRTGNVNAAKQ
jgi:hypothetical protein